MSIFKNLLFLLLLLFFIDRESFAQSSKADNLIRSINDLEDDSLKVLKYVDLGLEFLGSDIKTAISYFDEAILLSNKINYRNGLARAYNAKGRANAQQGDLQEAILSFQEALKYFREINDKTGEANILSNQGSIYFMLGNNRKALEQHFESLKISEELDNKLRIGTSLNNIGTVYSENRNTIDQALGYFKKSLEVFQNIEEKQGMATASMNIGEVYFLESKYDSAIYFHQLALELVDGTIDATFPLTQLGEINGDLGNFSKAYAFHRRALDISERLDAKYELTGGLLGLAKTQKKQKNFNAAIATLERAELLANEIDAKNEMMDVYLNLSEIHALVGDYKAAYENEINSKTVKEEIAKSSTEQMIQQLQFEYELDKKEAEIELLQKDTELKNAAVFNQRIVIFASLGGLVMFVVISISLFRNNLSKQKANRLLQIQKEEIHAQRENVEIAYDQLKSAQAQLIQSEKMASLGELTAGIAHEIKNPLNFVNNFSEVCSELIEEMKEELTAGHQKLAIEIADDIKINLDKINQHGKRADSIVQGMLEHSRSSIGEKVDSDINKLAEEFFRLTYQSFLAKNKDFQVDVQTELDPNIPLISVIPQDFGKVLLNLYSNAFYAVNEKSNLLKTNDLQSGETLVDYQPIVNLTTSRIQGGKGIKISISDNGTGIPKNIKDKIFQPFFTTKPTGKGTGLGLSLSYDIVRAHGGEIKVESQEGNGTTFIISLPQSPTF